MNIYKEYVFPFLMNAIMSNEDFQQMRQKVLRDLSGVVLEIGFGTGLNLPFYSPDVEKIVAVDPVKFRKQFMKSTLTSPITVSFIEATGEELPVESNSIDHVVTTWTLCSVDDPAKVLSEIWRVLKPGGTYVFVEHGKSPQILTGKLQDWLTPIQKCIGCGCHLNRKIDEIIINSPLKIVNLENLYMKGPRVATYMYVGIAKKE